MLFCLATWFHRLMVQDTGEAQRYIQLHREQEGGIQKPEILESKLKPSIKTMTIAVLAAPCT